MSWQKNAELFSFSKAPKYFARDDISEVTERLYLRTTCRFGRM